MSASLQQAWEIFMYSFFLLLSIWLFLAGLFSQRLGTESNKDHLVPLTFVLSCIVQFNINYILIATVQAPRTINNILIVLACILMAASCLIASYRSNIRSLFLSFLFPANQVLSKGNKIFMEKLFRNLRFILTITLMVIMLITQLLTPTVLNWDSNWYNLARIPAMIIEHSVFPENSGSLWHVLHPLSHDLLYLFDIAVGSLRGMGLIATLEYFVILGCLYQLALSMLSNSDNDKAGIKLQCALLTVTVLFTSVPSRK